VSDSVAHPHEDFDNTVNTLLATLEYIRLYNKKAKLIYPSSAAVYGLKKDRPIKENHKLNPVSPYGFHKEIAEELITSYHKNFKVKAGIIRFFSLYGNGLKKQLLWDACNKFSASGKEVTFFGTGEETRDWIHIDDAVRLIFEVSKNNRNFLLLNGASGERVMISEVINLIAREFEDKKVVFNGESRKGDPKYYHADIKKAVSIGWQPDISFKNGIKDYVNWFRNSSPLS